MSDGAVYVRSSGKGRRAVYYLDEISRRWKHPWFIEPFYEVDGWKFVINPGFVNGEAALAGSGEEDDRDTPEREDLVPLTDEPEITIPSSAYKQPESSPEFFKRMGVKDPKKPQIDLGGPAGVIMTIPNEEEESPDDRMLLRAVTFLTQARATPKLQTDIPANLMLANLVDYTVVWDTTALSSFGNRPRVTVAQELPVTKVPNPLDILAGSFADESFDHLQIATLYFVSPPGVTTGDKPDGSWEPYVKHEVFWNLNYAARNRPPINIPGFILDPATAFFVGRYTFAPAATLGATNELVSRALAAAFNEASNRGRFWTV